MIHGPDGQLLAKEERPLSPDDARILREYKGFLARNGYREGYLWCEKCQVRSGAGGRPEVSFDDVAVIGVGTEKILIECGCTKRYFVGRTLD